MDSETMDPEAMDPEAMDPEAMDPEAMDRLFCLPISKAKRYFLESLFATCPAPKARGVALLEGYNAAHALR